jgi:hypothetical protein
MKTLKVEAVYENEREYMGCVNDKCKKSEKTGCDCGKGYIKRKFTSYEIRAEDGNYYRLSGKGTEQVRVGDEITGIVTEESWDNGEKSGINRNFKFPKPEDIVKEENEQLKAELAALKGEKPTVKNESTGADVPLEDINIDDIPF